MFRSTSDLDAGQTLRLLQAGVAVRRQAEVDDLLLVLHWADLHGADLHGSEPGQRVLGGERLDDLGGDGTPGVQELAICELGIARGVHTLAARAALADALNLRHRLPQVWAAVLELAAEPWIARKVATMSRRLILEQVGTVDRAVADAIVGQAPSRVLDLAAAKIVEADQVGHDARVRSELARRYVGLGRTDEHGLRAVVARVTAGDAHWVDATVARVAEILADRAEHRDRSCDELRSIAFGWLARPAELLALLLEHTDPVERTEEPDGSGPSRATAFPADLLATLREHGDDALRPRAVLYVHLHQAAVDAGAGVARVEGLGAFTLAALADLLARTDLVVKPVIDLEHRISTNAYEHPETVKERIHLLRPGDAFPHASRMTRHVDLDHPVPYDPDEPPGQTSSHTSQPLGRTGHRAKTHLGYRCAPVSTGEMLWRTPHGLHRLVDHAGTHVLDDVDAAAWGGDDALDRSLVRLLHRHRAGLLTAAG